MGSHKAGQMGVTHGRMLAAEDFPPVLIHWLQRVAPATVPDWYPGQALTEVLAGDEACPLCLFEEMAEVALYLKKNSSGDWIAAQGTLFTAATFVACHLAEPTLRALTNANADKIERINEERAPLTQGLFELIASFGLFRELFSVEQLSAIAYLAIKDLIDQINGAVRVQGNGGEELVKIACRETVSEIINMLETVDASMPVLGGFLRKNIKISPKYAFELVAEYLKVGLKETKDD